MNPTRKANHGKVAKKLGIRFRVGRFGIRFFPKTPSGIRRYKLFSIVPLDGWITDPKEVTKIMRERGLEL